MADVKTGKRAEVSTAAGADAGADVSTLGRLLASPPDLPVAAALPGLRAYLDPGAGNLPDQPVTSATRAGERAPRPGAPTSQTASPTSPVPPPAAQADVPVCPTAQARTGASRSTAPALVVTAPPGTGKTTLVPVLVAETLSSHPLATASAAPARSPGRAGLPHAPAAGHVVVTQPRRVAARAAARRLARLLGEEVGGTVGYAVRGQRRASAATRVEVVTTGVLLRRLQADPALDGVVAVVLDEVHERSLEADLLIALLVDARAALRQDLAVVAMSATLDAERLGALLDAPVVSVPGSLHPVSEHWAPPPGREGGLGPQGVTRDMLRHVADTAAQAVADHAGDVLVFLPGAREVDDVAARLRAELPTTQPGEDVEVPTLHASLPPPSRMPPWPAARRAGGAWWCRPTSRSPH